MQGSVYKGYLGMSTPSVEYNVFREINACRTIFSAPWDVTITPLDTCGIVQIKNDKFQKIKSCNNKVVKAILENYEAWTKNSPFGKFFNPNKETSICYDTVAIYLAFSEELLNMESLGITVTDKGETKINDSAKKIQCAISWKDLQAFEDFIVNRLTMNG